MKVGDVVRVVPKPNLSEGWWTDPPTKWESIWPGIWTPGWVEASLEDERTDSGVFKWRRWRVVFPEDATKSYSLRELDLEVIG